MNHSNRSLRPASLTAGIALALIIIKGSRSDFSRPGADRAEHLDQDYVDLGARSDELRRQLTP